MQARKERLEWDKSVDLGSARIQTRMCYVLQELELLEELQAWKAIQSVIMIDAQGEFADKTEEEYRFYLSSKKQTLTYFNSRIREHSSIENQLHWHLDLRLALGPEV